MPVHDAIDYRRGLVETDCDFVAIPRRLGAGRDGWFRVLRH
jgi:hypothetical protein